MRKKKPVSKEIVRLDPPWPQGKLPAPPTKGWSLPKLHAAAAAAASLIEQAEGGYITATYWLLGQYLIAAERLSKSPADFFSWRRQSRHPTMAAEQSNQLR